MPYVRISVPLDRSDDWSRQVADQIHAALVDTFDVPEDDRFQLIEPRGPAHRIFDRHYLAGPRSDEWILIAIVAGKPRTAQQKHALYRALVERLGRSPGIDPADVMIVVQFTGIEDWSFGHGAMTMVDGVA